MCHIIASKLTIAIFRNWAEKNEADEITARLGAETIKDIVTNSRNGEFICFVFVYILLYTNFY